MGLFEDLYDIDQESDPIIDLGLELFINEYNYHFYDRLLPVAIKSEKISAKDLMFYAQ